MRFFAGLQPLPHLLPVLQAVAATKDALDRCRRFSDRARGCLLGPCSLRELKLVAELEQLRPS